MVVYPCLFSITWYLAFLAADWSRTVSTSPLQLFHCCPLVLETLPSSFGLSPIGTEGVTLLASPAFPVDLPSTLSAVALRLFGFLSCFVGASVSPYCLGLFSPRCCFCPVTGPGGLLPSSPSGLCPLFVSVPLGCCAWSFWPQTGPDFQRHPLFLLSFHLLFPSLSCFFLLTSAPVWYLWPQTGQGYHFAGPSVLPAPLFEPSTVSGRRLVRGCCFSTQTHGTPH